MIGFLLKKTFYDLWDNLFKVALINIGFIACLSFPVFVPPLLGLNPTIALFSLFAGILFCFVYLSAAALSLKSISDYGSFGFADFFGNFKIAWPFGLFSGSLVCLAYLVFAVVLPFYLAMESILGLLLASIIFWGFLISVLSLQFFFAVRSRLDSKMGKVLKKCFIIFFDNPMFCLFSLLHNIFILIISLFTAFLFPGPAGALLFLDEGLRLRLLKYDWLEANPEGAFPEGSGRREIPWDTILIEEREKTGSRSFRNFIFPWKD
ncbi:MAG: hypothetical protein FWH19_01070 [Treponema sp.]|nr:hypothetical protein [Treponema sp.]